MKKMFVAAIAVSALFFVSSCNSAGGGDPKATLSSFFDAMADGAKKKDFTEARKLATADSKSTFDMMESAMKMMGDMDTKSKEQYDKSKMEIGEAKIDGDKATVPVKELKSGESVDFTLKKESGSWKVAMDMGTMMEMGMKKLKEKGMDSLSNEIKNLNTDSLRDIMEKSIQMLDTLKKKSN
jgi:hypothetical protein